MCRCESLHLAGDENPIHSHRESLLWISNTAVIRSVGDHEAPGLGFKPVVAVALQSRSRGRGVRHPGGKAAFGGTRNTCNSVFRKPASEVLGSH